MDHVNVIIVGAGLSASAPPLTWSRSVLKKPLPYLRAARPLAVLGIYFVTLDPLGQRHAHLRL